MKKAEERQYLLEKGLQLAKDFNIKESKRSEYASAYVDYFYTMKTADRKLRQLEALSHQEHYEGVLGYAYARAQKDIAKWKGTEYNSHSKYGRFSTKPPESLAGLYAKIQDAERFNSATTSSKRGITSMYKKRADTMNDRYTTALGGKALSWQELATFFEKEYNTILDGKVGSASVFTTLGVMKRYGIDDKAIFEKVLDLRKNDNEVNKLQNKKDKTADEKKILEVYNKINNDSTNSKYVKSPKVETDILRILSTEEIDLEKLFSEGKKVK